MTLTFTEARIQMDSGVWLCLKVNEPAPARTFILDKQNRIYDCEIKEHREKRSLDANAYCWVLLDKLADAIHSTKEEIYLQKVRYRLQCTPCTPRIKTQTILIPPSVIK